MSVGKITAIAVTPGATTFAGTLKDLETNDSLDFKGQTGLDKVSQGDVVEFQDNGGGGAENLVPLLQITTKGLGKSESATRRAVNLAILLCAKDTSEVDIMIRKF